MNFDEYQNQTTQFNMWALKKAGAAIELASESGKLVGTIKKFLLYPDDAPELTIHEIRIMQEEVLDEVGDVLWALSEICNAYHVRLVDVAPI